MGNLVGEEGAIKRSRSARAGDVYELNVAFQFERESSLSAVTMSSQLAAVAGGTIHKISRSITFYPNELVEEPVPPPCEARPLLVLFPWLGARPRALSKYCAIYFKAGFDVLIVESEVSQFLWPRWGMDHAAKVLEVLQSDRFVCCPLLVHAFSIGGYTFTNMLVHMSRDSQRYRHLNARIRGHIYDSLVVGSLERMVVGHCIGFEQIYLPAVRRSDPMGGPGLFLDFKRYTVDYFTAGIRVFLNSPITTPALFFFCENDVLCDHRALDDLIEDWRRQGTVVQSRKWAESTHAGHLLQHSQEYLSSLEDFLGTLNILNTNVN
ncbi:hypothetical protein AAFF_G00055250 [Aldrovandia affinis]|uniref:Transmembrane protein 53 n=1 Tax=Aldrovandia affinis TaxID=143900 RepID=A0AAD7S109_9TELE|nr:hypothetical protein AAFF_G00055250 [Aldrovandia affinis]